MQPTTKTDGEGRGRGGGPIYPASIKQVTHLASVIPKIEAGDKSSYGLLVRPLTMGRQGLRDGQFTQLPHIHCWIKGDLVEEEIHKPVYLAGNVLFKGNVC